MDKRALELGRRVLNELNADFLDVDAFSLGSAFLSISIIMFAQTDLDVDKLLDVIRKGWINHKRRENERE